MDLLDFDAFDLANQVLDAYPEPTGFGDFGPYSMGESIGSGGMGSVFLAEDKIAGRRIAIKFLRYPRSASDLLERFTREIKTLAKLEHPFIARLYDAGVHPDGTPYFAMEYVEGRPLDEYCRAQKCAAEQSMRLLRSVCEAVQYAHTHLVIHRDLKFSNILVKADGTPKLLDFGIAKQLETNGTLANETHTELRFTRSFAAPEQLRGEAVGVYTDVYAIGVILYELLAGKPPYELQHCTPAEAERIITGDKVADKPSTSTTRAQASKAAWSDLDVLCLKAMRKDASRRYHSVVELTQDIDRYLSGEPLQARPDTLRYRVGKFVTRNRRAVLMATLACALVAGLVIFFMLRLTRERDYANRQTAITAAMNRFLSDDLLGRSDPFKSGKAQESFAEVVNRAATQIDNEFAREPVVAARLHETIAKAFDKRSDFPKARQEYDRAYALFRQDEGPLSQDAALIQLQRAIMETISYERGSLALAKSLVNNAERSIAKMARPRDEIAVNLPYARGVIAIAQNDATAANRNFAAALDRARAISSPDSGAQASMKQMVAFSYIRLDEGAKAEPLIREVIATYSRRYGPASPDVLRAEAYLSMALMRQGKYREAIREIDAIYPVLTTKLGEDHQVTLTVLGTRAAAEGYLGMWEAASSDDMALYRADVRKQGPVSLLALGSLADAALSQCRAGRHAEGEANARKAYRTSSQAFGVRAGMTGGSAYALATCLIDLNKLGEAEQLLRDIDAGAVAQLSGDSSVSASVTLAQGQIAVRQGDYAAAQRYMELAAPTFERPNANSFDKNLLHKLKADIGTHTRTQPEK